MKFTLGWLKDHLETEASIDEIATALSAIGLEVDGIEDPGEALGAFTIARVTEAAKHPDADKLQVLQVEIAPGEPLMEVVCGAPNARAGMLGVFAPIGTYVPGLDVTLVKKPVRGVVSNGMMCSAAELELSDESAGIIEVDEAHAAHVGQPYIEAMGLNDPVFDVALTPNRPDCTGVRGIARDLAAAGLGTLKPAPDVGDDVEGAEPCPIPVQLDFASQDAAKSACPVFAARLVDGVKNGPSPEWLTRRLEAIGLRPINALVDVTNYISYDLGRPLHVYDADKLNGAVSARLGRSGESFVGLDEKTTDVDETMCVIADDNGPLGLGGVMGGLQSGVSEATTRVLIESAWFDPVRTAQTGRKTGLVTDARYRFERGVDPQSVVPGLDLATRMILDICGGQASAKTVAGAVPDPDVNVSFDPALVEKLTGLALPDADIVRILQDLGFTIEAPAGSKSKGKGGKANTQAANGAVLQVAVPSWRPDVSMPADLVEEVLRIAGIDNVPSTPLSGLDRVARATLTPRQKRARRARRTLAARGLIEAITWSFIPRQEAELFAGGKTLMELDNPISVELSTMRPSLLPGLLAAVQRNRNRGFDDLALFELGQAYGGPAAKDQTTVAAGIRSGAAHLAGSGRHWDGATAGNVTAFDAKADVLAVLAALGIDPDKPQITRDAPAWYHPGQSGTLRLGPKVVLAHFGIVNPRTLKALDVDEPLAAFEIFLDHLPTQKTKPTRAKPRLEAGDLMPVRRDFAFVVDQATPAGDVVKAARGADKTMISDVNVFDVFSGGKLAEEGKKSLALQVTLQPADQTLTDKDIEGVADKVIAAVKKATGGEIRG